MTSGDQLLVHVRGPGLSLHNRILPVLFTAGAAAILGSGFVSLAPNRLVSGQPIGLFAAAAPGTLEARVKDAFRAYPEYASGSTRDEAELMRATDGLFCKAGAEGVYAVGLADGRGIALKLDDGAVRARKVVMAAVLQHLGITNETIEKHLHFPLLGGGLEVGAVQPHPSLFA